MESISGVNKLTANPVGLRTHKRIICRGGETAYALVSGTSDRKVVWVAPVVGVHQRSQQVDCKSRGIKNPQKNNMQRWRNGIRAGFRYQ